MQFGVCGDPALAAIAARASYDFAEWSVGPLLNPRGSEDAFRAALGETRVAGIPYRVVNGFVPEDLKITGPEACSSELEKYVTVTCRRAEQADIEVIVFGSGSARQFPEGFDAQVAREQLVSFGRMAAEIAGCHGIVIAVEPLNRLECNILTTLSECAALVREVAHPALRLLTDSFHLMREGDSYRDIVANADLLSHVHIATGETRAAPGVEPCDFEPFFAALAEAGYDGRISIETRIADPEKELPAALSLMRRLTEMTADALQARTRGRQRSAFSRYKN